jgi:glycosyltransferase involved in cell wall biosynthesis
LSALVSVVMPVFNTASFVAEAIKSVLSQEAALDIELIVVDDGSADGSAEVVMTFGGVRLLRHDQNRGIGAARNTGVRAATGEFLAFLDADDVWPQASLSARLAVLDAESECDAVAGGVVQFGAGRPDSQQESGFLAGNVLVRRDAFDRIGEFDETLRVGEFIDWYARAIDGGLRFRQIDTLALRRRIHASNTMLGIGKEPLDYTRVLRQALARRRAGAGE